MPDIVILVSMLHNFGLVGTAAGSYPREVGSDPHCIATSYEWFKRVQIIDLAKNAIVPHMLHNPDLKIYVCEW